MRIVYSLPHPGDTLASERAGHVVRANALLAALEDLGHDVVRLEAADDQAQRSVQVYRQLVRRMLPKLLALTARDAGRYVHSRRYAERLVQCIEAHRPDVLLETCTPMSIAGVLATRRTGVPLVVDDLAPSWEDEEVYDVRLRRLSRRVRRETVQGAAKVVAVNDALAAAFVDEGINPSKILLVGNGVGPEFLAARDSRQTTRRRLGIGEDELVIVFVGSFQPFHQVDALVGAFHELSADPRLRLLLVGDGPCLAAVRYQVAALGLDGRVTLTGAVPHAQVALHMGAGDVGVLPASTSYTNPMKIVEYLAAGLPVVAPRHGTVTELVTDGVTGRLFDPDDREGLACALGRLLSDRASRDGLAAAATASVAGRGWADQAARLVEGMAGPERTTH